MYRGLLIALGVFIYVAELVSGAEMNERSLSK